MCEADPDHGFRGGWAEFVVFAQPSGPSHPGEVPLHDPAFGQDLEGVHLVSLNHLDIVTKHGLGPVDQRTRVAAVGEYLDYGVEAAEQAHQHGAGTHAVLNSRRMHYHR